METLVRPATLADIPGLAAIADHYVYHSTATFSTEPRSDAEWRERVAADPATTHHRVLVAERNGVVVGYAETARFRPKPGYDRSVEVTAYVAPRAVGAGVGGALYTELIPALDPDGRFHRAFALIVMPNPGSVALHERFGFCHRGTLTEVGFKLGTYRDVAYYQRALRDG